METLTVEFTAEELADVIGAVRAVAMLTETADPALAGVSEADRLEILNRYQALLARLTDVPQHAHYVQ